MRQRRVARCDPGLVKKRVKDVAAAAAVAVTIDHLNGLHIVKAVQYLAGVMALYTLLYNSACTNINYDAVERGQGAILDGSISGLALIQALGSTNDPWMMYEVARSFMDARIEEKLPPARLFRERLLVYKQQPFQLVKWLSAPGELGIHVRFWDADTADLVERMRDSEKDILELMRQVEAYAGRPLKPTPVARLMYQLARSLVERTPSFQKRITQRLEMHAKRLRLLII